MAAITFTVEGAGEFPIDMLRYDYCWPKQSKDSTAINASFQRQPHVRRQVTLATNGYVTTERWESFGWKVVTR